MPPDNLKDFFLQMEKENEFDVATADFADLLIDSTGSNAGFYFFYDNRRHRLIKHFLLEEGQRVDTMCDVVLIKKDDGYTPRLTFWKKDKTKGGSMPLTEEELVAEGRTVLIKSRVDLDSCHESLWKLIDFLRTFKGVNLPASEFRVANAEDVELAEALKGHDKEAVLKAVRTSLRGDLTEQDVQLLLDRRASLETFARMLRDADFVQGEVKRLGTNGIEGVWQKFFEDNTWIFGYGLTLIACEKYSDSKLEQITTGRNVFDGGGKRSDAVMRTRGFVSTLLFAEIKTHDADLLKSTPYRKPDVYQVHEGLSGAVSQVQKTAYKAVYKLNAAVHQQHDEGGNFQFEVVTIRPRQVVVIGHLDKLCDEHGRVNSEKASSFELYRRDHQDVEILTFDELYERARFIVESPGTLPE